MMSIVFGLFVIVVVCIALAILNRIVDKIAPSLGGEVAGWIGILKAIVGLGILILVFYWLWNGGLGSFR